MRFFIVFAIASAAAAQPSFEVASVKQLATFRPGTNSEQIIAHPGTLTMSTVRLSTCILWAYDLMDYQVSAPSWVGHRADAGPNIDRFDILAKAQEGTSIAEMKRMLQRLLSERFKLIAHRESKVVPALALTVARSSDGLKLSEDQSSRHLGWSTPTEMPFRGATMAEFGEYLAGFLGVPVVDRTGLNGRFDFTVKQYEELGREAYTAALPGLVKSQLGLELKRQREQLEFLVIDSLEKKPTGN